MKRIVYILLVLSLVFALVSCEGDPVFSNLTSLSQKPCSMVRVNIETLADGAKLNSTFKITGSLITYSIDLLSEITLDGDEPFKTTKTGEAFVTDGVITSMDGSDVELPEYELLVGKFTFKADNFIKVTIGEGSFSASIVNLGEFLMAETDGKGASVSVEFNSDRNQKLILNYIENGSGVKVTYEFY